MLKWIKTPEGKLLTRAQIEAGQYESLPAPANYLRQMFTDRTWDGTPHVTGLLSGPRKVYLEATVDYALTPDSIAFAFIGSGVHSHLEGEGSEQKLIGYGVQGTMDLIEEQPDGSLWIIDYKAQGAYAVAKALGIQKVAETVLDEFGNPQIYKSGKKAGQVVTRQVPMQNGTPDLDKYIKQLNAYRVITEQILSVNLHTAQHGYPAHWAGGTISKLKIFFIVRDGNTMNARDMGIIHGTYYVDIPIVPDQEIIQWIGERRDLIINAFDTGSPRACDADECWSGRMCKSYCPVAEACKEMGCPWL